MPSGQKGHLAVGEKGKQLPELAPCTFAACDCSQLAATSCREVNLAIMSPATEAFMTFYNPILTYMSNQIKFNSCPK